MSETSESVSGDTLSGRERSHLSRSDFFFASWDVSASRRGVCGRGRSLQSRGKKGGGAKLWKSSRIFAEDVAAEVHRMVDLPVGVLGTRGPFSPLSGRFHLGIAAKEKLRIAWS